MEPWSFQRFQRPRLCVDAIEHEAGSTMVYVRSGPQTHRIAFDDSEAAARISDELRSLRDGSAPLWSTLRASPPDSGWHVLATFFDTHSLIGEDRDDAAEHLTAQTRRIRECVEGTLAAVLEGLSAERLTIVARHAELLRRQLRRPIYVGPFAPAVDPFDATAQPNFFLALAMLEIECFRRFSPLALFATDLLLGAMARDDEPAPTEPGEALADVAGLHDEHGLAAHLWLMGRALVSSSGDDAARLSTAPIAPQGPISGMELMRRIEVLSRATLTDWGENPYVTAVAEPRAADSPLVVGLFIERYHVTRRFVEIIAPLLSMRLAPGLRSMMFRYYGEEHGHDALERSTCEAFGVAGAALDRALPLPLHFAFVDALTLVADMDPIASFAAVITVEGLFGEPPKLAQRLLEAARAAGNHALASEHDDMNDSLSHNSISRNLFESITAVSPARQASTMRRVLFLLELNHRAWSDIADFYGSQEQLSLLGPFGRPLHPRG